MKFYLKKRMDIKKITFLSILVLLAVLLSMAELWFPSPVGIPGIKPGLAGIAAMTALVFFSYSNALFIMLSGCLLTSLLAGGPTAFLFSLCGGILSVTVMWIMLKSLRKIFSLVGIGITGAIVYNIGQVMAACFVMSEYSAAAAYLPALLTSGILTGAFNGFCSMLVVKALKKMNLMENI